MTMKLFHGTIEVSMFALAVDEAGARKIFAQNVIDELRDNCVIPSDFSASEFDVLKSNMPPGWEEDSIPYGQYEGKKDLGTLRKESLEARWLESVISCPGCFNFSKVPKGADTVACDHCKRIYDVPEKK